MKSKSYKFLLPILTIFLFVFAIFVLNDNKVQAADSLNFYYPNNYMAKEYNENGTVVLKDTLVVYFHDDGVGYTLDNDKLRIGSIDISNGSVSKTITSGYSYSSVDDYSRIDKTVYGNLPSSGLKVVKINLAGMFSLDSTNLSNTITMKMNLQKGKFLFWTHVGWETYDFSAVYSYKGGEKQASNSVGLSVTDLSFTSNKLSLTGASVSDGVYNISDYNNNAAINLNISVNFRFIGYIHAYYNNDDYVAIYFNGTSLSSGVNLKDTGILTNDSETVISFSKFQVYNATDRYGSNINNISGNHTASFKLDTKAPTVTSSGVATEGIRYDVSEFIITFNFSESIEIILEEVYFDVGGVSKTITCNNETENCSSSTSENLLSISKSYDLSGNGKVELEGFRATIKDSSGNETKYTRANSKVVCNDNKVAELVSSIKNVSSEKSYYYENDTITFNVEVTQDDVNFDDFSKVSILLTDVNGSEYGYDFTSAGKNETIISLAYIVDDKVASVDKIEFYKVGNDNPIYIQELSINLNTYLSLDLNSLVLNSPEKIIVYSSNEQLTLDASKISIVVEEAAINYLSCTKNSTGVECSYTATKDGSDKIKIGKGAIILSNGQKNNEEILTLIANFNAPNASIGLDNNKFHLYGNYAYYKNGMNAITFALTDGYAENKCLYYKLNDGDYNSLCGNEIKISLPEETGNYILTYYLSDGVNQSAPEAINTEFKYHPDFAIEDILIKVNNVTITNSVNNIDASKKYNQITLEYEGGGSLDFLEKFEVNVASKLYYSSQETSDQFTISKSDIGSIEDTLNIVITLTDALGNKKVYNIEVNIDTIAPSFASVVANSKKNGNEYEVTVSGIGDNELKIKVGNQEVSLNGTSFVTESEKYTIILTDAAGNSSQKIFTTIPPSVELNVLTTSTYNVKYEIYIAPFDSTIHEIEEYKYLVFEYLSDIDEADIENAKNNVCTVGRKTNCYVNGSFNSSSNVINQTFDRGYAYILEIKINNVLAKDNATGKLPRIDILAADAVSPEGEFLDDDVNPDYVSSTSGKKFEFKFLAKDSNLTDSYYYMIVKSTLNSKMNVSNFYELYKTCYGAIASSNGCAIKGSNKYDSLYDEATNTYSAIIDFVANSNTKRRMEDNVTYSLFVVLSDTNNNSTLFKIREFKNITKAASIEYLTDLSTYAEIEDGEIVTTVNSSKAKIEPYNNVEIKTILLDGINQSFNNNCELSLTIGKRVIEVEDVLGNKSTVTIYSATANNPIIEVYYNYQGEYFKILDNTLSYNSNNANNVYVKVIGLDLATIQVMMNSSGDYQDGSAIFESITDDNNQYGTSLLNIMQLHNGSLYSGRVSIKAINSSGGQSEIALNIDNQSPDITLVMAGVNVVNLLGQYYDLAIDAGVYSIEYNYQRDITYGYLMNALSVNVDGIAFNDIKGNNRFKLRVDGALLSSYEEAISKGTKLITLDYFDNAGNPANTVSVSVTVKDNEKPNISLTNTLSVVELNVTSNLATVITSDNHDLESDLVLTSKIGGEIINHTNHKFTSVGEYTIIYEVKDTSSNTYSIEQVVIVRDTTAPALKENTLTEYTIGINKSLYIPMPVFIDNDASASEYKPFEFRLYDINGNVMDSTISSYPLIIENDQLHLIFTNKLEMGEYKLLLIASDSYNNAREEFFTIDVVDDEGPTLEIKVNNREVNNNETLQFAWGSEIVLSAKAMDGYLGDLTSRIIKKITYKGATVNTIDTTKNGIYTVEFKVKDDSLNETIIVINIEIDKDEEAPVINNVFVDEVELSKDGMTKIASNSLKILVDASDDFGVNTISIKINDNYTINNGQVFTIDNNTSGKIYNLYIVVKDKSGNETNATYSIIVDNKKPLIGGFQDNHIYSDSITMFASDENIKTIKVYKNSILNKEFAMNVYDFKISGEGLYSVIAEDTYGNKTISTFAIMMDKVFNIVDDANNTSNSYRYDYSSLIETRVDGNTLTFVLGENSNIDSKDRIYILVNYPNSDYKYIAYSMDGNTFLSNKTISIDQAIIEGSNNADLLEKIDDKYYSYVMIVRNDGTALDEDGKGNGISSTLKDVLVFILVTISIGLIVFLIIKMRRRVRAV